MQNQLLTPALISELVTQALNEDLNFQSAADGDITAQLIPEAQLSLIHI